VLRKNEFILLWAAIFFLLILIVMGEKSSSGIFGIIRLILGCLFVLIIPGYALTVVLFPGAIDIGLLQRLSISIGISIALLSIMALILDHLTWGITLWPVAIFLTSFTFVMTLLALFRRHRLPVEDRFVIPPVNLRAWWRLRTTVERAMLGVMMALFLAGVLVFASLFTIPDIPYSEFYVLGPDQVADMYPRGKGSENITIRLGITNYEGISELYRIDVLADQQFIREISPIFVPQGKQWEDNLTIDKPSVGIAHTIEFHLFRQGDSIPYRTLRLELHDP
jgi:uncharacterized membrane protein